MNKARQFLPPLILIFTFILFWEGALYWGWIPRFILPAPQDIVICLFQDSSELVSAFFLTTLSAFLGFLASSFVGIGLATLFYLLPWLNQAARPFTVVIQTLPIVAIAPILVIWFGYGVPTVISCTFVASVFPILSAALTGLNSTDPALLDLFRLYQASRWNRLWRLVLPSAVPFLLTGFRISAGLAVIGAIVGEFVGGGGLGSIVEIARSQQRVDKVFAAVFLACVLGMGTVGLVNFLSWLALRRWKP